jgi:putative DNA primase/helicase
MPLRAIVRALGGDLYDGGRRANIPAPGHSPRDRSVSLLWTGERVVVHGFGTAGWHEVLDDLRARGLIDAAGAPVAAGRASPPQRTQGERMAVAQALWAAARPLPGTLAERHLRLRGIRRPFGSALRYHPAVPVAVYADAGGARPALLAAITDFAGALTAVELTYLDPNGRRAQRPRTSRKTVGVVPPGAAVRLDPPDAEMLVAEGVVTTLAATERFTLPGWALLAVRNLVAWTPPAGVRRVLIAGDRGRVGEAAASHLAHRLAAAGVAAEIAIPPPPFGDWSEAAEEGTGEGRSGRA